MDKFQIQSKEWAGLAKVLEETSELNVNLAKLMATGGDPNYWGGVDLIKEIQDEISDTFAAIAFFLSANQQFNLEQLYKRAGEKLDLYIEWRENNEG